LKDKTDTNRTDKTSSTPVPEPNKKDPAVTDSDDVEELSDTDLEQVSGGGDGGSTWTP